MSKATVVFALISLLLFSSAAGVQFVRAAVSASVSIDPPSASIDVGESVEFTSTVTGEVTPYSYQWFLNGTPFQEATSASWTFTPSTSGVYSIYLVVSVVYPSADNSTGNLLPHLQSETATVVVGTQSAVGFFGYPKASSQASGSGTKYDAHGSRFMLGVEANVTSISCLMEMYLDPDYLNRNYSYSFAIYRDNNEAVGSLLAQTVQGIISHDYHGVPLWYTLNFPSLVHLTPGSYWLMAVHDASQFIDTYSSVQETYESVSSFIDSMTFPTSLPSPIYTPSYVYCMYASWAANFSASLSEEKNIFSVTSNSTVTSLAYNSSANVLSFKVSGPSGTTGYTEVFISKTLLTTPNGTTVFLDGKKINSSVTSIFDSWTIYFVYSHSTHNVAINMGSNAIKPVTEFPELFLAVFLATILITLLLLCGGLLLYRRKRK